MVHESIPGHHYQISHMLSEVKLPDFRRYSDYSHLAQYPFSWPSYSEYVEVSPLSPSLVSLDTQTLCFKKNIKHF